jgi:hypothetical protein
MKTLIKAHRPSLRGGRIAIEKRIVSSIVAATGSRLHY